MPQQVCFDSLFAGFQYVVHNKYGFNISPCTPDVITNIFDLLLVVHSVLLIFRFARVDYRNFLSTESNTFLTIIKHKYISSFTSIVLTISCFCIKSTSVLHLTILKLFCSTSNTVFNSLFSLFVKLYS